MRINYKLQITNYNVQNYKGNGIFGGEQALNQFKINPKGSHGLHQDSVKLQTMIALIKSFCGGTESVGQWVSGSMGQLDDKQVHLGITLIMMPRLHPETNKNQHKQFAQHIGSPRRGALAAGGKNEHR